MKTAFKKMSLLLGLGLVAVGCGKQAYVVTASQTDQQAPGSFMVAPKVDILLVQDDTGSSHPIYANISSQLGTFLSNIQGKGWDYHFATIPLTSFRAINQVQASQYDPNWGSQWISPYPGADPTVVPKVSAGAFRFPGDYTDFLGSSYQGTPGAEEPGLGNLYAVMRDSSMSNSGFLRQDAFFAVVVLSTGDDTSRRNICTGSRAATDGWEGPCDLIPLDKMGGRPSIPCGQPGANPDGFCNNYASSLNPYQQYVKGYKGAGNSNLVKFYSVVSSKRVVSGENCLAGANTYIGQRYQDMSSFVGGKSYDICTVPIPNVLSDIASNLSTTQLNLYTSYLFVNQEPDPSTIVVYRNPSGNTEQAVVIPQDSLNGWTFEGYVTNVLTTSVGSPTAQPTLNRGTGYAIKLHGSAIIGGSDTPTVTFNPAGIQNNSE